MNNDNPSLGEVTRGDIVNVRFNKWGVGPSNARGVVIENYETPVPFHVRKIWFHRGGTDIKAPVYELSVYGHGETPELSKSTAPITVQEAGRRVAASKGSSFVWEHVSEPDGPIQIDVTPRETTSVYTVAYSGND
jgi:hypothetical protein